MFDFYFVLLVMIVGFFFAAGVWMLVLMVTYAIRRGLHKPDPFENVHGDDYWGDGL